MRNQLFLPVVVFLLCFMMFLPLSTEAAVPAVTLEAIPASVRLGPGETKQVMIIARNSTEGKVSAADLSFFSDEAVKMEAVPPENADLGPSSSCAWLVNLKKGHDFGPSTVHFRLNYQWTSDKSSRPVQGIAVTALPVEETVIEKMEGMADVKVETSLETLEENRPGSLFVVVKNLSTGPITVASIHEVETPEFVKLTLPKIGSGVILGPRESHAFPVGVKAGTAVQTGQHLLVFEVRISRQERGQILTGSVIVKHPLKVGVMMDSDILKLLGVPSFLLLPGFLMLTAFMLLWGKVHPGKVIALEAKSAEFWLVAITLSLATAPAYPRITGWLGESRDYLIAYGLKDVFSVWIGSILSALLAWVLVNGGVELRRRIVAARHRKRVPTENDTPVETLRKLALNSMGFSLPQVDATPEIGKQERFFVLPSPGVSDSEMWIAPPILYVWKQDDADFKKHFMEQMDKEQDSKRMAKILEEGLTANPAKLEVNWKLGWHPTKVARNAVTFKSNLPSRRILEELD